MKEIKEIFKVIRLKSINENKLNICKSRTIVSVILCLSSAFMLAMNLKNHSMLMAYASIILVVGFLISGFAAGVMKNSILSGIVIALLVGFVLSLFALTGGNEGFAILWVLLVPMFAISLLGLEAGLLVSTYFMIFLFVIFSTPARACVVDKYKATFISRFPILYLCDYAISTYFSIQRLYYHKKLEYQAYADGLTGLYNRRYFMEQLQKINNNSVYSIVMVDLNGLKNVNDELGHEKGDSFICNVSDIFAEKFADNSKVCRIGGDEIAIISYDTPDVIDSKIKASYAAAAETNAKLDFKLSFSVGVAHKNAEDNISAEKLFKQADKSMYENKIEYYKDSSHNRRKR